MIFILLLQCGVMHCPLTLQGVFAGVTGVIAQPIKGKLTFDTIPTYSLPLTRTIPTYKPTPYL